MLEIQSRRGQLGPQAAKLIGEGGSVKDAVKEKVAEKAAPEKKAGDGTFRRAGKTKNLSKGWKADDQQKEALGNYSREGYKQINGQLRKGTLKDTGKVADRVKAMDQAFKDAPPLAEGVKLTRRLRSDGPFPKNPPPMDAGGVFQDDAFGSTTKVSQYGTQPMSSATKGSVEMEIRVPAGATVLDMNGSGADVYDRDEHEVLLNRGAQYRVVSDSVTESGRKIVVEVVS